MASTQITAGTVHELPDDLSKALASDDSLLERWEDLTPLARNEWICWTISVKQQKTRDEHVKRAITELKEGKRRPCCWVGCMHRTDKPMNPTQKWIQEKQTKSAK